MKTKFKPGDVCEWTNAQYYKGNRGMNGTEVLIIGEPQMILGMLFYPAVDFTMNRKRNLPWYCGEFKLKLVHRP